MCTMFSVIMHAVANALALPLAFTSSALCRLFHICHWLSMLLAVVAAAAAGAGPADLMLIFEFNFIRHNYNVFV